MRAEERAIRSAERDILQVTKWNRKLSRFIWGIFAILVAVEVLTVIVFSTGVTLGSALSLQDYIVRYFITPCLIVFSTVLISQILRQTVIMRFSVTAQSRFILGTIILMITEAVAFHHGISVIYTLYVLPIIISIIYVEYKTLLFTYVLSIAAYLLVFFLYIQVYIPPADYDHNYMDILGTLGLLTAVYVISYLTLSRVRELINTAVAQRIRQAELKRELTLDSLTQLFNHATFYEKLDEFILQYKINQEAFSIAVLDIDDFKQVNDTYGHDMGNLVLLKLVEIMRKNIRKGDLAFRYGGEEFTIITSDPDHFPEVLEHIRHDFGQYHFEGIDGNITVSAGVCTYDYTFGGRREFFSAADKALYRAKSLGKNRVEFMEKREAEV